MRGMLLMRVDERSHQQHERGDGDERESAHDRELALGSPIVQADYPGAAAAPEAYASSIKPCCLPHVRSFCSASMLATFPFRAYSRISCCHNSGSLTPDSTK